MSHSTQSLASHDPFDPGISLRARRAIVGAKVGFVMDLAWTARVLRAREEQASEES